MKKTTKNFKLHYLSQSKKALAFLLSALFMVLCCPISFAEESSSNPLTPSELAQMSEDEVAAISQEQSDATLNKMVQLFQDGKKDALNEYLSALGFATSYEEYVEQNDKFPEEPSIQPLWQSDYNGSSNDEQCHEGITSIAFILYVYVRGTLFNGGALGFTLSDLSILSKEAGQPDSDPVSVLTGFAGHFYNPNTELNFLNDSGNTAKTNANSNYYSAIDEYKKGNRTAAMTFLSHALHYVQDAGEPHHSSNLTALPLATSPESGRWNHAKFEARATDIFYNADIDVEEDFDLDTTFYNKYTGSNVAINYLVHDIAAFSQGFKDAAISEHISMQEFAAVILLNQSIADSSGILYKFATESGMI